MTKQPQQVLSDRVDSREYGNQHSNESKGLVSSHCARASVEPEFSIQFVNQAEPNNVKAAKAFESRGIHIERWIEQMLKKSIIQKTTKEVKFVTKHFGVAKKDNKEVRQR